MWTDVSVFVSDSVQGHHIIQLQFWYFTFIIHKVVKKKKHKYDLNRNGETFHQYDSFIAKIQETNNNERIGLCNNKH